MAKVHVGAEFTIDVEKDEGNSLRINGQPASMEIQSLGNGHFHVLRDNKSFYIEVVSTKKDEQSAILLVNGKKTEVAVKDRLHLLLEKMGMTGEQARKVNELKAPMPGLVLEIKVAEGAEVKAGDPLLILEAMKMENVLKSPGDGIVKSVQVKKGTSVEKNQLLIAFQ